MSRCLIIAMFGLAQLGSVYLIESDPKTMFFQLWYVVWALTLHYLSNRG